MVLVEKKKKKGIWIYVVYNPYEDFEGEMKQMWVEIDDILDKQAGKAATEITT